MRAVAVNAEAVERRDAECGGEIAVAAAAGHLGVLQVEADAFRDRLRVAEQHVDGRRHLEWRAVHSADHLELHARIEWLEPEDFRFELRASSDIAHAQIDAHVTMLRDDVRRSAALDHTDRRGDAAGIVGHPFDRQHLARHLPDRAASIPCRAPEWAGTPVAFTSKRPTP